MQVLRIHDESAPNPLSDRALRRRGLVHLFLGIALLTIAVWGLWHDVRWVAQPFYAWVWWGYIFLLDGFCVLKRGDSILTRRLRFLVPIAVWSTTFWFFFELLNARMQNWYYVGVYPAEEALVSSVFTLLAFATVFMGIFQTYDALAALRVWRNWQGKRRRYPARLSYILQALGLAMGGLAIAFPYYLAPLIWGSFTLVIDPWNYRRGARSLLRDLEQGDFGLLMRLLLAGLICGVVWESLNYLAPQKWIYTVRGLENVKLFEMPMLGFLGFPALALDSTAGFALFSSIFLGNRSWECDDDLSYPLVRKKPIHSLWFWGSIPLHLWFCGAVYAFATPVNIGSLQLDIRDLLLSTEEQRQLGALGITRPRQFLRKADSLRDELGWTKSRFDEIRDRARLYTFKGIGPHHGRLLEVGAGVRTPENLRSWSAEELHGKLTADGGFGSAAFLSPRLDFVRVWVLSAPD